MRAEKANLRAKRIDRAATWVISLGGVAIIATIVGIFVEIFAVTLPLFMSADATQVGKLRFGQSESPVVAATLDDYFETAYAVYADGSLETYNIKSNRLLERRQLDHPTGATATAVRAARIAGTQLSVQWEDGAFSLYLSRLFAHFADDGSRIIQHQLTPRQASMAFAPTAPTHHLAHARSDDDWLEIAWLAGAIHIRIETRSVNFLGEENLARHSFSIDYPEQPFALLLSADGFWLTAVTDDGGLMRWRLSDNGTQLEAIAEGSRNAAKLTAAELLLGDHSVLLGRADGSLESWFPVRDAVDLAGKTFRLIHPLPGHAAGIVDIAAFPNNKSLLSISSDGQLSLAHATSERRLLSFYRTGLAHVGINQRGDGLMTVSQDGAAEFWRIDNPHPEISLKTLFGKVWYEGYDEPAYAWQSSSASTDFEPKLSLMPLISGTMKAAFFALLFSVPLALLAAIYANQFLSKRLHEVVKPVVELMAAFPSVVVGFLAALWLAPFLEENVIALALSLIAIPMAIAVWLIFWQKLERRYPKLSMRRGLEYALAIPLCGLAVYGAGLLASPLEALLFSGDFNRWLFAALDIRYDQRNSIVIAIALGFAVVPIVFTISDDALSNVPKSMTAASLAVGASRWQTVWKIVLPSASPGIFAAIMIGLGRAVGETMIVLMAAGNTPIMDWDPFTGMRTLSANIAVEIAEAPHGGTLYRVLFLSALLLFAFTFVANTIAETVRANLRKKYGRF